MTAPVHGSGHPVNSLGGSLDRVPDRQFRHLFQRLQHHAVTFGQLEQRRQLFLVGVGLEGELQPDPLESDRRVTLDGECSSKIEILYSKDCLERRTNFLINAFWIALRKFAKFHDLVDPIRSVLQVKIWCDSLGFVLV